MPKQSPSKAKAKQKQSKRKAKRLDKNGQKAKPSQTGHTPEQSKSKAKAKQKQSKRLGGLAGWLVGWLVGGLAGWLVGWVGLVGLVPIETVFWDFGRFRSRRFWI